LPVSLKEKEILNKIFVAAYYFPNYHTGDSQNDLISGENWND
jgi:hypothetical protein